LNAAGEGTKFSSTVSALATQYVAGPAAFRPPRRHFILRLAGFVASFLSR
jgi:hypothetical protein